jgi:DNA-binding NarL/FixJ family response regulator
MEIRVMIADDHRILREGLRSLLHEHPGVAVVAEAEDGRSAVHCAEESQPDIAIVDVTMPGLNGIEATRQIRAVSPATKVIALTMHAEKQFVTEMLKAGASAYVLKDSAFGELSTAISAVMRDQVFLSPHITGVMVANWLHPTTAPGHPAFTALTPREREVLQLLAEGHATKQIARHLNLSGKTVDAYRQQVMEKLNLHSVAELTKYAISEGLTQL